MKLAVALLLTLGVQLLLGWAIYAAAGCVVALGTRRKPRSRRRLLAAWVRARRRLLRAVPVGFALTASAKALAVATHASVDLRSVPVGLLLAGVLPTASGYVMLDAAWLESRGQLRWARRQVRLGGQLMFVGVVTLLLATGIVSPGVWTAVGWLFAGSAAAAALLAGLAGKPRPSAWFAALLYLAGLTAFLYGQTRV